LVTRGEYNGGELVVAGDFGRGGGMEGGVGGKGAVGWVGSVGRERA
jgi:hypothetical protein